MLPSVAAVRAGCAPSLTIEVAMPRPSVRLAIVRARIDPLLPNRVARMDGWAFAGSFGVPGTAELAAYPVPHPGVKPEAGHRETRQATTIHHAAWPE